MAEEFSITIGAEPGPGDVVFDCTNCGRSLCIDRVAAGFSVTCPHCQAEQLVPGEPVPEDELSEGIHEIVDPAVALRTRVAHLEHALGTQQGRLDQVNRELALIQASLDRIVSIMSDAQAEFDGLSTE